MCSESSRQPLRREEIEWRSVASMRLEEIAYYLQGGATDNVVTV